MTTAHQSDHQHALELDSALDFINTLDLDDGQLVEHFQKPADAAAWFADRDLSHRSAGKPWTVGQSAATITSRLRCMEALCSGGCLLAIAFGVSAAKL